MDEPNYGPVMEDLWNRLPDIYRDEDAKQEPQYPLKRYLSAPVQSLDDVVEMLNRFYVSDPTDPSQTSDLIDPSTADESWLPYIAMFLGVDRRILARSVADQRTALSSQDYRGGTAPSIINLVRSALTGGKYCRLYNHTSATSDIGAAGQWDVLIVTRASETNFDVPQYVMDAGLKPAGVKLWHRTYEANWATIMQTYPTWAQWNTATWQQIEEAGF